MTLHPSNAPRTVDASYVNWKMSETEQKIELRQEVELVNEHCSCANVTKMIEALHLMLWVFLSLPVLSNFIFHMD